MLPMWLAVWNFVRDIFRLLVLSLFIAATFVMGAVSWVGLAEAFRPEVPPVVLAFSVFARFNLYMLAGSYCFAAYYWHLPMPQALLYVLPALGFMYPPALVDVVKALWTRDPYSGS